MQDKTIDNALLALRKQIIREGLTGLEHAEALLQARGVHMPRVMLAKRKDAAKRGHMRLLVMQAVGRGGATIRQIAEHVASARPELTYRQAYKRSGQCLDRLRRGGVVVSDGGVWQPYLRSASV